MYVLRIVVLVLLRLNVAKNDAQKIGEEKEASRENPRRYMKELW